MPNSITSRCCLRSFPAGGPYPLGSQLARLEEKTACPDCALRGFTKVRFMVSLPLRTCLEKLPPDALPCDTRQLARESHLLVLPVFGAVTRNSFGENGGRLRQMAPFCPGDILDYVSVLCEAASRSLTVLPSRAICRPSVTVTVTEGFSRLLGPGVSLSVQLLFSS